MPINYPTLTELEQAAIAEVRKRLPNLDPTVLASFIEALVRSEVLLSRSLINVIKEVQTQLFPQTATGEFLDLWGGYEGLSRLPAASSVGTISVTGTAGVGVIPLGTQWTAANGIEYEATTAGSISTIAQVVSLTFSGTTATVTTTSDHFLATGQEVFIIADIDGGYDNPNAVIAVTSATTFTYELIGSPSGPDTGTASSNYTTIQVTALTAGADGNQSSGAVLTINTSINGVNDDALVQVDGLIGGAAEEEDDAYRTRILLKRSTQEGVFTPDQIRLAALGLSGNTRVNVVKPSSTILGSTDGYAIQGDFPAGVTSTYGNVPSSPTFDINGNLTVCFWLKMFNDSGSALDRTLLSKTSVEVPISSIVRAGSTATVTTIGSHNQTNGEQITVTGATQPEYNVTGAAITVTGANTFTYTVAGTPATPATGAPVYTVFDGYSFLWDPGTRLISFGNSTNFASWTMPLSLEGQWVHVTGVLTATNIKLYVNGVKKDDQVGYTLVDNSYTAYFLGNPGRGNSGLEAHMDETAAYSSELTDDQITFIYQRGVFIDTTLKGYWKFNEGTGSTSVDSSGNGNTFTMVPSASMWVPGPQNGEPGMIPVPGQVVVYILRDNDASIIPSQTLLDATKQLVIDDGKLPAHMSEVDLFVLAPTPVSVDFTFTAISPDTTSMRNAITAQLEAFFRDDVEFEQTVTEAAYLGAINGTFDTVTSERLTSFTLSAPTTDVAVGNGAIGILGKITWPP